MHTGDPQRISGPFYGYFIAAAVVAYSDCWIGQAKLYTRRPASIHDPDYDYFVAGDAPAASAAVALADAEAAARRYILSLSSGEPDEGCVRLGAQPHSPDRLLPP